MVDHAENPRRNRTVWITLIALGVVVLAVASVSAWRVMGGRLEAARQLDRATLMVERADNTVIAFDEVVRAEVSPSIAIKARQVEPRIESARKELEASLKLIDSAMPRLTDDERRRAMLLKTAAAARIEMLDSAPAILSANIKAADATPLASGAWTSTLAAAKMTERAVAEYNKLTKSGVQASATFNAQAEQAFTESRDLFSRAATAFPEAGMERYVVYLDQKLKQVALSRQSDAAWIAGDISQANRLIAAYNVEDAKSVALVKELPVTPSVAIADAYKQLADPATAAYFKGRRKAADADKALKAL